MVLLLIVFGGAIQNYCEQQSYCKSNQSIDIQEPAGRNSRLFCYNFSQKMTNENI
jgi:hypothetical protein